MRETTLQTPMSVKKEESGTPGAGADSLQTGEDPDEGRLSLCSPCRSMVKQISILQLMEKPMLEQVDVP